MFKDTQAREDIKRLRERVIELEMLLDVCFVPTFLDPDNKESLVLNRLFKLASTLGYEYKEETKEAGWVKKEKVPAGDCVYGCNGSEHFCGRYPKKSKSK